MAWPYHRFVGQMWPVTPELALNSDSQEAGLSHNSALVIEAKIVPSG